MDGVCLLGGWVGFFEERLVVVGGRMAVWVERMVEGSCERCRRGGQARSADIFELIRLVQWIGEELMRALSSLWQVGMLPG